MLFVTILIDALTNTWSLIAGFLPGFILAVLVLLIGGLIAFYLKRGVIWAGDQLQLNKAADTIGLKDILARGGKVNISAFLGWLAEWFIVIVTFVIALDVMGLVEVTAFFATLGGYALHVITAILILLVGIVVAKFLSNLIQSSVKIGRLASGNFLANVAWLAVFVFTLLVALRELQAPEPVIQYLVIGAIAALALASGIALGTGKDKGYFGKLLRDITK